MSPLTSLATSFAIKGRDVEKLLQRYITDNVLGWTPFDAVWVDPTTGEEHLVRVLDIRSSLSGSSSSSQSLKNLYVAIVRVKSPAASGANGTASAARLAHGAMKVEDDDGGLPAWEFDYGLWITDRTSGGPSSSSSSSSSYGGGGSGFGSARASWKHGPERSVSVWDLFPVSAMHGNGEEDTAKFYALAIEQMRFFWDWLWDCERDPFFSSDELFTHHELEHRLRAAYTHRTTLKLPS